MLEKSDFQSRCGGLKLRGTDSFLPNDNMKKEGTQVPTEGERVKIPLLPNKVRKKELDNGHNTGTQLMHKIEENDPVLCGGCRTKADWQLYSKRL